MEGPGSHNESMTTRESNTTETTMNDDRLTGLRIREPRNANTIQIGDRVSSIRAGKLPASPWSHEHEPLRLTTDARDGDGR